MQKNFSDLYFINLRNKPKKFEYNFERKDDYTNFDLRHCVFLDDLSVSSPSYVVIPVVGYIKESEVTIGFETVKVVSFIDLLTKKEIVSGTDFGYFPASGLVYNKVQPLHNDDLLLLSKLYKTLSKEDIERYSQVLDEIKKITTEEANKYFDVLREINNFSDAICLSKKNNGGTN